MTPLSSLVLLVFACEEALRGPYHPTGTRRILNDEYRYLTIIRKAIAEGRS